MPAPVVEVVDIQVYDTLFCQISNYSCCIDALLFAANIYINFVHRLTVKSKSYDIQSIP